MLNTVLSETGQRPGNKNPIDYFFEKNSQTGKFADFPKSKHMPTFIYLSEEDLLHIFHGHEDTRCKALHALELANDATVAEAVRLVLRCKGLLINSLLCPVRTRRRINGYHGKMGLQMDTLSDRFKLKGTICTNGLVLNLLSYDTTKERPKARASSFRPPPDDENGDLLEQEAESSSSKAHLCTSAKRKLSAVPSAAAKRARGGAPHTSVPPRAPDSGPISSDDESDTSDTERAHASSINWKRGSKMLRSVKVVFDETSSSSGPTPFVVGMDPGEVKTMVGIALNLGEPQVRRFTTIRRSFLYGPYIKYCHLLEERKAYRSDRVSAAAHDAFRDQFVLGVPVQGWRGGKTSVFLSQQMVSRRDLGLEKSSESCIRSCQIYCDRDMVESENIVRVCLSHMTTQTRPNKFKPTSS
ncbi:hypothetical protein BX616_005993 [Lobosporangium transversale]|nr:hypothetical protein BX616_005993 [Lobosporangium transversale]